MRKTWMAIPALAGALWIGSSAVTATAPEATNEPELVQWGGDEKLPKPSELKTLEGKMAGHKTPLEVVTKAVKAAKESKIDEVKMCFPKSSRQYLDNKTYVNNKETTQIKLIADFFAKLDASKLKELKQNTVGRYAVVMAQSDLGTHLIRVTLVAGSWRLLDNYYERYTIDYLMGMDGLRKAITSGKGADIKPYIDPEGAKVLDLLADQQAGVDPYDLLAKRLQKIISADVAPHWLVNRYTQDTAALWFHSDKGDSFLVINIAREWDNKSFDYKTVLRIPLDALANFAKDPGPTFKNWVANHDWDFSNPEDDESGDKPGDDKGKGDGKDK